KMWLRDYHIDGLRLDAIHAIVDTSAFPFLEQLSEEIKQLEAQLGRHLVLIAESDLSDPRVIRPRGQGGFGYHAQWNDDFHHALHTVLTNETQGYYRDFGALADLAHVFRRPYLFARRFSPHRQRSHGRPVDDLEASSFLAYSQNHDQVGNRATGERLHHLLPLDQAKIAAALTILSPYVPMLFQGEEWAASSPFQYFVDFSEDSKLARAVSEGRRSEFAEFPRSSTVGSSAFKRDSTNEPGGSRSSETTPSSRPTSARARAPSAPSGLIAAKSCLHPSPKSGSRRQPFGCRLTRWRWVARLPMPRRPRALQPCRWIQTFERLHAPPTKT
ncbi:MAG TPA: hypothetical protein VGK58_10805, partial [Lacipirellulaceae bacterium]